MGEPRTAAPTQPRFATIDGNEAAAYSAYRVNEVCAVHPAGPMAECVSRWASEGKTNTWGGVPDVVEMPNEAGAAGAVHGALQGGSLTTAFTGSPGLMLMIPNMYRIAGELTPAVFHVAARSLAAQSLSVYGDHQDVMASLPSGFALLAASSVQEAHDFALIAQAATLESRIPFVHFFDGSRTSDEIAKIELLDDDQIRAMIDDDLVLAHRSRALNPDHPFIRGTAMNPDVYFQARETVNPFYERCPEIVRKTMAKFSEITGRPYKTFDYFGHRFADRVIVLMGSGADTVRETVESLAGEHVGVLQVHLFRPWSAAEFLNALPATAKKIAVLDRTKEPGSSGEPLYLDVVSTMAEAHESGELYRMPKVVGGRYGLASKEFDPAMVMGIFEELKQRTPKNHFTVGIDDDVSHSNLTYDPGFSIEGEDVHRAVFYGLGADGTVDANKSTIEILAAGSDLYAQGYFVGDPKRSGTKTISHLRFGPRPIRSAYLIKDAHFVGCHRFGFLAKLDVLERARPGATFLLNSPHGPDDVWDELPNGVRKQIVGKRLRFFVIDAQAVAQEIGLAEHEILQICYFATSGVLSRQQAIAKLMESLKRTPAAIGLTLERLYRVNVPMEAATAIPIPLTVSDEAPQFVRVVTSKIMCGHGNDLPVSAMPVDGAFPSGTSKWEKRNIADLVPVWEPELCVQCGNCVLVCPHATLRAKLYDESLLRSSKACPPSFKSVPAHAHRYPRTLYTLQLYAEDCTGCGLCVQACPVSEEGSGRRALDMGPKGEIAANREELAFFESLPVDNRSQVDFSSIRGTQFLEPLFEFSSACPGCGETPYLKLLTQLFGDRMMVANATGCSSMYGGSLPTTPWSVNAEGRGPSWSNSLFEDNAEFGLGMRLAADRHRFLAQKLLREFAPQIGEDLVEKLIHSPQQSESEIREQRARVAELKSRVAKTQDPKPKVRQLLAIADHLVRRSVWIIGGDGWALEAGSGGLDHVLAGGRDVNILVLAKGGRSCGKDLALQALSYGNVYVARIALGANPQQTLEALREAEAYNGPSLILAYTDCTVRGIDVDLGLRRQFDAVQSGAWPLLRYNPAAGTSGGNPFVLDAPQPAFGPTSTSVARKGSR
ncbi:MAG TPA: pyruvate:ferredoxin (flavodoxin) oxidoreductase [Fimbriimonadaceae bacterium]|nr:pyruvate:ferredoxin (flavodoxin) oxidoreductase [Fimbriimonadaceae bacterium]